MSDVDVRFVEGNTVSIESLGDREVRARILASAKVAAERKDWRYFGLTIQSDDTSKGRLGYYVGVGRLPEAPAHVIRVVPREFHDGTDTFSIDYMRLYAICAAEPEVSRHLDRCLAVYPDEFPVPVRDDSSWSALIALAYVKAVHTLVQRQLRRGFIVREETLRGRVRGQINIGRHLARGVLRGHPEDVPCRFQQLEQDTLENRILRTALVGARRLLGRATGKGLRGPEALWESWARQAETALTGAKRNARIRPRDFHTVRRTGAFRHYAQPLILARAVLTRTGFDPSRPIDGTDAKVRFVPFRLDTAELFERYVEACVRFAPAVRFALRARPSDTIRAGYHNENLGEKFKIRPDLLVRVGDQRLILDAKYKDLTRQQPGSADGENNFRMDAYQVLSYTQHEGVQRWFAGRTGELVLPSAIVLCYPAQSRDVFLGRRRDPDKRIGPLIVEIGDGAAKLASRKKDGAQLGMDVEVFSDFVLPLVRFGLAVPVRSSSEAVTVPTS